jgi:hypothetical protein
MNTRRAFLAQLAGIGLFSILPGVGRIWRAERRVRFAIAGPDFVEHCDFSAASPRLPMVLRWCDEHGVRVTGELERTWLKIQGAHPSHERQVPIHHHAQSRCSVFWISISRVDVRHHDIESIVEELAKDGPDETFSIVIPSGFGTA